jgi:Excreted virulence factor EspC, type VII ESX diderm
MADSYTVHDRADVEEKLDELGVHSVGQIRRAHGSRHHRLAQAEDAERLDLQATGSPDQIAANFEALVRAKTVLGQQADAVNRLLAEAQHLATPMRDGHGPIAAAMKAAFNERADDTRGAVRALTDYRDELALVLAAIQQTLDSYNQSDLMARQRLSVSGDDHG